MFGHNQTWLASGWGSLWKEDGGGGGGSIQSAAPCSCEPPTAQTGESSRRKLF